jgi:hypothetical protein
MIKIKKKNNVYKSKMKFRSNNKYCRMGIKFVSLLSHVKDDNVNLLPSRDLNSVQPIAQIKLIKYNVLIRRECL